YLPRSSVLAAGRALFLGGGITGGGPTGEPAATEKNIMGGAPTAPVREHNENGNRKRKQTFYKLLGGGPGRSGSTIRTTHRDTRSHSFSAEPGLGRRVRPELHRPRQPAERYEPTTTAPFSRRLLTLDFAHRRAEGSAAGWTRSHIGRSLL